MQRLFIHQSLDNISRISQGFYNNPAYSACPAGGLPNQPILWEVAKHGTVRSYRSWQYWHSEEDIQAAKEEFSKNLVSYCVWLHLMLWYGSLQTPFVMQAFLLWCRSVRSLFCAYALFCRANIIGPCVTQPKIARTISMVSGVLWWQYTTYASPCIMTKASSWYHMWCTHFVCHILEGVWLLALPKADWVKVCPGSSRVCPWTVFSFIDLDCCPMTQRWDEF